MIKSTIWNTKFEFEKTIPANTTTVEMYVYCPEWAGVYLADTKISEVWEKEWTKLTLTAEQYNAVLNGQSEIKLEGSSSLSNKAIYFSNIKTYREKSGDVYFDHALGTIDEDTTIKYGSEQSSVKLTVTAERRHLMYKYCTAVDETQYNAVLLRVYQTDAQSVSWDTAYFMLGAKDTVIDSPDVKLALNKGSWTEILITPAQYNAVVRGEKVIALGSGYSFYNDVPFYLSAPTPVNDGIADHMLINMPIGIDDEISLTSYSSSIKHGDDSLSTCVPQANWEKISVRFENAIDDTDVNAVKLYVYADVKYGSTFNAAAVTLGTTSVGNVSAQETWTEIILTKAQFNSLTDDSGTVLTFANSSSGINGMIFYFSSITPYNDPLLSSPIQVKAGAGMSVSDYTGSDITPPESGLGFKKCDCSDWNAYFTFDCDAQIDTSITSNVSFYIWSNYVPGVDWCPNGYIQFGDKRLALLSTEGTWVKVTLSMSDFKALLSGEKSMYLEGNGYSGVTVYVSDIIIG